MDPAAASETAAAILLRYTHLWITDTTATPEDLATDLTNDAQSLTEKLTNS